MSSPDNPFEQDWEAFRFPVRPVRIFSDAGEAVDEDDGEDEGEGGGSEEGSPSLEMGWHYMPELSEIHHPSRRKRIKLSDLSSGVKIIRLLAAIEARPELDVDGLIDALEYASWDCYGQSLGSTLEAHSDSTAIVWSSMAEMKISHPTINHQNP